MSTPDFEIHRAIVHSSDPASGRAEVRIPSLLGATQIVGVPTTGLVKRGGRWNVPSAGTSLFIAVSVDRTQFLWLASLVADNTTEDTVDFTVGGGTTGAGAVQPTFTGDPLFEGRYVRHGDLVFYEINVDFDNITSFGQGQYYVTLPFPALVPVMMRGGCLHDDSTDRLYAIGGHVDAGSTVMTLWYTSSNGLDEEFDYNSPLALDVADNFHVSGTYIAEP